MSRFTDDIPIANNNWERKGLRHFRNNGNDDWNKIEHVNSKDENSSL